MSDLAKRIGDLHHAAVILHGLTEGLHVLIEGSETVASPTTNAAYALSYAMTAHTRRLADEIEAIEDALRKKEAA